MDSISWGKYPRVANHPLARKLLSLEAALQRSPHTIDAYARGREDFFSLCERLQVVPEEATREHVALWAQELSTRPANHQSSVRSHLPESLLSNATIQQRLTAVRLFYDFLVENGARSDNPVGRGRYTPGKVFSGSRERGILKRQYKPPWIPNDEQWLALLNAVRLEPVRNRVMFAVAYDAALRREEVCRLEIADLDFGHRLLTVRGETTKNGQTRVVPFSMPTAELLSQYLRHRRQITAERGPLFLSESRRNGGEAVSIWTWSKVAARISSVSGVTRFSTHTLRHLCLTDLARSGWDIHEIALFAGHQSLETTKDYIHLSGRDLAEKLRRGMSLIHERRAAQMGEQIR